MRAAHEIRRLYWRIARPRTRGARVILLDDRGRVGLVRHTYQDDLYLPGGGVRRRESFLDALKRELAEELGVTIDAAELQGEYLNTYGGKRDRVAVFVVRGWGGSAEPRAREIDELVWVEPEALPPDVSRGSRRRIDEFAGRSPIDERW